MTRPASAPNTSNFAGVPNLTLNRFKAEPGNLISVATLAELEFEDRAENVFTALSDKVKAIFSRKQASDDARFQDVHEAVTTVSEHVQENLTATEQRLATLENAFATLKRTSPRRPTRPAGHSAS